MATASVPALTTDPAAASRAADPAVSPPHHAQEDLGVGELEEGRGLACGVPAESSCWGGGGGVGGGLEIAARLLGRPPRNLPQRRPGARPQPAVAALWLPHARCRAAAQPRQGPTSSVSSPPQQHCHGRGRPLQQRGRRPSHGGELVAAAVVVQPVALLGVFVQQAPKVQAAGLEPAAAGCAGGGGRGMRGGRWRRQGPAGTAWQHLYGAGDAARRNARATTGRPLCLPRPPHHM